MKKRTIIGLVILLICIIILGIIFIQPKQKNLEFTSSDCKSSGDFEYLQGVRNVKWIDNSTMGILARVSINCADSIKTGSYSIKGNKVILDYKIKRDLLKQAMCICNHDLSYNISDIEKKDYEVVLKGYEDFDISCVGLNDENYELQSCCQALANDKELVIPICIGNWTIKNNECYWQCTSLMD